MSDGFMEQALAYVGWSGIAALAALGMLWHSSRKDRDSERQDRTAKEANIETRLASVEKTVEDSGTRRRELYEKIDDVKSTMDLQMTGLRSSLDQLIGELRGAGIVNGKRK